MPRHLALSLRRLGGAVVLGTLAGLTAIAIDELLLSLIGGHYPSLPLGHLALAAVQGCGIAFLLNAPSILHPSWRRLPLGATFVYSLAIIYGWAAEGRVDSWLYQKDISSLLRGAAGLFVISGYAGLIWFFGNVLAPRSSWFGRFLAVLVVPVGLIANQNQFYSPLSPAALMADTAILVGAGMLAVLYRVSDRRRAGAAIAASLVVGVTWIALRASPGTPEARN